LNKIELYLIDWEPFVLSLLRIVTGFLFLPHGMQKLFSYPSRSPGGKQPLMSLHGIAGILEFFGAILIMLGLFTRPIAFVLSGLMAVAYFTAHAPQGFWPAKNQGETAVLYCFIFLYLCFAGGGPLSLDVVLFKSY
jgi:putative oxidoreductase